MNRLLLTVLTASCLIGCGPGEAEIKEALQLESQAAKLDSLSAQIEKTRLEIESSTNELMDLRNKL